VSGVDGIGGFIRESSHRDILPARAQDQNILIYAASPQQSLWGVQLLKVLKASREVSQKWMRSLIFLRGLNQTMVKDVLPEWGQAGRK
jgi:hypothetical protein